MKAIRRDTVHVWLGVMKLEHVNVVEEFKTIRKNDSGRDRFATRYNADY